MKKKITGFAAFAEKFAKENKIDLRGYDADKEYDEQMMARLGHHLKRKKASENKL